MHDEAALIQAVQASPQDVGLLSIYADWLEERGDDRARYLRVRAELAESLDHATFMNLATEFKKLRQQVEPLWLAEIESAAIENCAINFEFLCPKRWEKLAPTDDPNVRFCEVCQQQVFFCSNAKQLRKRAKAQQ